MTPLAFKAALDALHWNQRAFAAVIGKNEKTVRRWADGSYPVPDIIADGLTRLLIAVPEAFNYPRR